MAARSQRGGNLYGLGLPFIMNSTGNTVAIQLASMPLTGQVFNDPLPSDSSLPLSYPEQPPVPETLMPKPPLPQATQASLTPIEPNMILTDVTQNLRKQLL